MEECVLRLFIAGGTPVASRARANLVAFRDNVLKGRCRIVVVDVLNDPAAADEHRIIATPTLLKESPGPIKRLIGDLSDQAVLFEMLGIDPASISGPQTEAQ